MRLSVLLAAIGAVALVAMAACGKRSLMKPASLFTPRCEILPAPAHSADSITVAMPDVVELGRVPWAGNASERLLFRHLYETLITVDCLDQVCAGLAVSWKRGEGGRRWTFELREGALFWDGTSVTAGDVVTSWQDAMTLHTVIDSVGVAGGRRVHVYLKQPHDEVPRALSASVFAVTKAADDSGWLVGSGPYRIVSPNSYRMGKRTITVRSALGGRRVIIRFMETSLVDARDLLERGIDVMVTSDPSVIEYSSGRPQFVTVELPWDRTYVLLSTSRMRALAGGGTVGTISSHVLDGVAQNAVRGDARGHVPPSWWEEVSRCLDLSAPAGRSAVPMADHASSDRIVYDVKDPIARDLAERVVALGATDPVSAEAAAITLAIPGLARDSAAVIAEGVTTAELARSLRDGNAFAYIVVVPTRPPDPCYEAHELIKRAPWLASHGVDFAHTLVPLVDARSHVIAKRGRFGLMSDGYGSAIVVDGLFAGR